MKPGARIQAYEPPDYGNMGEGSWKTILESKHPLLARNIWDAAIFEGDHLYRLQYRRWGIRWITKAESPEGDKT